MRYYLSSYKLGDKAPGLKELAGHILSIAYIPNALDHTTDNERRQASEDFDLEGLRSLDYETERVDLREYFNRRDDLRVKIDQFSAIFVRGGNVFVLRQAMMMSGLDVILKDLHDQKSEKLYIGYSSGACILAPSLQGLELVDSIDIKPYGSDIGIIWEGLGMIDYAIVPHFRSEHRESAAIDGVIERYLTDKTLFKALRDGEYLIINNN